MNKLYNQLFSLIARNTASIAEQVMDEHKKNNEEKQFSTAQTMRDDFLELFTKLKKEEELNRADYSRLLVGTVIVINNIESRIKQEQAALQGYKVDLFPKLDQINNAKTDEEALNLAKELFLINT